MVRPFQAGRTIKAVASGIALGIEIVTPQTVSQDQILAIFDRLGLERPSPSELEPLHAA